MHVFPPKSPLYAALSETETRVCVSVRFAEVMMCSGSLQGYRCSCLVLDVPCMLYQRAGSRSHEHINVTGSTASCQQTPTTRTPPRTGARGFSCRDRHCLWRGSPAVLERDLAFSRPHIVTSAGSKIGH